MATGTAWEVADRVGAMLDEARQRPHASAGISVERAEELVAQAEQDRSWR